MFTYQCKNERDLIGTCERIALTTLSGEWFFRGQSNSEWTLVPSLLRPGLGIKSVVEFEAAVVSQIRKLMLEKTTLPDRLVDDDHFVLATAQHYGVNTRMLDWTRDPDVALYFAASGALRSPPKSGLLSVFAMASMYLNIGASGTKAQLVYPPRAANQNLAAQRGLLVRHEWDSSDLWDAATAQPTTEPVAETLSGKLAGRLIRLDLASEHAGKAVGLLSKRGVEASTVFPSEHGVARFGEDMALLDEATLAKIHDTKSYVLFSDSK